MDLDGKGVLMAGIDSHGIGFAAALLLAQEGAHIFLSSRDFATARRTVTTLRAAGADADLVQGWAEDLATADALLTQIGRVDVLVNNETPALELTVSDDHRHFEDIASRMSQAYFLTTALAARMETQGGGSIVNLSAVVTGPSASTGGYATRSWVEASTTTLAVEYALRSVRVNAISARILRAEAGETQEMIAQAVVFLASERSSSITGAILTLGS